MDSVVDYVEININNIGINLDILIDVKKNSMIINEKYKDISKEEIEELFRIIRLWDNEYLGSKLIDSEKFTIKIVSNNNIDKIVGNGNYPDNYNVFKKWVGGLYE